MILADRTFYIIIFLLNSIPETFNRYSGTTHGNKRKQCQRNGKGKYRYEYKCCATPVKNCRAVRTEANDDGKGKPQD